MLLPTHIVYGIHTVPQLPTVFLPSLSPPQNITISQLCSCSSRLRLTLFAMLSCAALQYILSFLTASLPSPGCVVLLLPLTFCTPIVKGLRRLYIYFLYPIFWFLMLSCTLVLYHVTIFFCYLVILTLSLLSLNAVHSICCVGACFICITAFCVFACLRSMPCLLLAYYYPDCAIYLRLHLLYTVYLLISPSLLAVHCLILATAYWLLLTYRL